ncbi:hypothetical protein ACQ33O_12935 [Ferruginibacter sp. SUN002]|uniref:hypothetical protein n=1 Tax=Ferruginibacter sp. SUN002 TaxID=2937789 RepID=UPI003D36B529
MKNLTNGISSTFKQNPLLTILTGVFSVYILSLLALVVIVTVAPESSIGSMVDNLF